ncbi:hypothetical protein BS78_02G217700 [Paspalum vaginatum]|nr:hypothetical protein BS78_02G217700 [Paspalum vaginatum]
MGGATHEQARAPLSPGQRDPNRNGRRHPHPPRRPHRLGRRAPPPPLRLVWSIKHVARKVDGAAKVNGVVVGPDGPFYQVAVAASNTLHRFADHVRKGDRSQAWYQGRVLTLRDTVATLQPIMVKIPGGDQAAGEDDDPMDHDGGDDDLA